MTAVTVSVSTPEATAHDSPSYNPEISWVDI